jgi:hypothetical protein
MAKRAHRADDKRRSGAGKNVPIKAAAGSNGTGDALANLFNDRRGKNGSSGKRAR